jgi:hypothetical protein
MALEILSAKYPSLGCRRLLDILICTLTIFICQIKTLTLSLNCAWLRLVPRRVFMIAVPCFLLWRPRLKEMKCLVFFSPSVRTHAMNSTCSKESKPLATNAPSHALVLFPLLQESRWESMHALTVKVNVLHSRWEEGQVVVIILIPSQNQQQRTTTPIIISSYINKHSANHNSSVNHHVRRIQRHDPRSPYCSRSCGDSAVAPHFHPGESLRVQCNPRYVHGRWICWCSVRGWGAACPERSGRIQRHDPRSLYCSRSCGDSAVAPHFHPLRLRQLIFC